MINRTVESPDLFECYQQEGRAQITATEEFEEPEKEIDHFAFGTRGIFTYQFLPHIFIVNIEGSTH